MLDVLALVLDDILLADGICALVEGPGRRLDLAARRFLLRSCRNLCHSILCNEGIIVGEACCGLRAVRNG